MFRKAMRLLIVLSTASSLLPVIAQKTSPPATLSAAVIVERNVAARGGLEPWRAVQTLTMTGRMEAGGNNRTTLPMPGRKDSRYMPPARSASQVRLPFVMELKRPLRARVEVQFNGQTAVQVFDGNSGWKLRPFLNRREVEPYSAEEMKSVATQAELDGPLVDYARKGTAIELVGTEKVEGRDTYKLRLTLKSGKTISVWIDAQTFLETKIEGTPRLLDGKYRAVDVYYRDYRAVGALKIPFTLETKVLNPQATLGATPFTTATEQILLEKVEINSKLEDALFSKAGLDAEARGIPASTTTAAMNRTR